ncbi:MAG: ABC transporter ATP-binding protein [Acidobacteriota bacterium]
MRKLETLLTLSRYVQPYRLRLAIGFGCVTLSNLAAIASPWLLKLAIDRLGQSVSEERLLFFAVLIVLFATLEGLFLFLMRRIMIGVSRYIEYDLRNDLFAHLLGLSRRYYQHHRTGDIMSRATNDMNAVRMLLGPGIMYSANTIIRLAVVLTLMLRISVQLTIFTMVAVPAVSFAVRYFGALIHERFERIQEAFSEISSRVQENLSGVRVIKAFTQENSEIAEFKRLNQQYIRKNLELVRLWGLFYPLLGTLLALGGVFVLWFGGRQVIAGKISLGDFVAFNAYLGLLTWPMIALGWVINIVERGTASLGRMNQIFDAKPEVADRSLALLPVPFIRQSPAEEPFRVGQEREEEPHERLGAGPSPTATVPLLSEGQGEASKIWAVPPPDGDGALRRRSEHSLRPSSSTVPHAIRGEIEFRAVSFSYNASRVLHDINLIIPAGATFALVGETGSGKTTTVNLLARLYDVTEGEILIDGRPLQSYPLGFLRASLAYVPQESFLFSESIRENIAFGVESAGEEEIRMAAGLSEILPDIVEFPRGLDTLVGERGITLSGGQQQRTAIARALIRSPRILVLDDALSSVDTLTEERILGSLGTVMRGRTCLLISHRVSTVKFADRIVVLRRGRIIEQGAHQELLRRGGYYAELYQKQLLEQELEET